MGVSRGTGSSGAPGDPAVSPALDPDLLQYLSSASARLEETFEDAEERSLLVAHVLAETRGQQGALLRDRAGSHVLERLLPLLDEDQLADFSCCCQELGQLVFDPCASRVLESLLSVFFRRIYDGEGGEKSRDVSAVLKFPVRVADALLTQCERVMADQCGSHVLRAALQCLSGQVTAAESGSRGRAPPVRQEPPAELLEKFSALVQAVTESECVVESLDCTAVSAVVQVALQSSHAAGLLALTAALSERVSGALDRQGAALFDQAACVRALESCVTCAPDAASLQALYERHFSGRVLQLLATPGSRIAVQRLVDACEAAELLGRMLGEMEGDRAGECRWWFDSRVPVSLCRACVRVAACQAEFVALLRSCLQLEDSALPQHLVLCVLYQVRAGQLAGVQAAPAALSVPLQGSLLLQSLLQFSRPAPFIAGLLQLPEELLAACWASATGSHVLDRLLELQQLGEKRRGQLLRAVHQHLPDLACSRHGSRVLETAWRCSSISLRAFLAETLVEHRRRVRTDLFGRHVHRLLALDLFATRKQDWLTYVKRDVNKRRMFADIVADQPNNKRVCS